MHSFRPHERRRTRPRTGCVASFFAFFFLIEFRKAFFPFLCILGLPWGPQKSLKIGKNRVRKPSFFRVYAFHAFLTNFGLFWMILRMQNVCISLAGPTKYAFSPKMSFDSPGTDFGPILAVFWVSGGVQNEEKSVPGGGRKKRRFSRALFFRLWLILGALEGHLIH